MLRSLLFFGHVDAGGLEHQLFRAHLLERHLDERVAAHRRNRDHQAGFAAALTAAFACVGRATVPEKPVVTEPPRLP